MYFTAHTVLKRYLSSLWLLSRVLLLKQPCNVSCDKIQQYDLEALPQNCACTIENTRYKVYFLKQPLSFQLLNKMRQAKPCNFMAPLLRCYELCQRISNQYHCCPEGSQQIISLKASFSGLIHLCIGSCLKLNIAILGNNKNGRIDYWSLKISFPTFTYTWPEHCNRLQL